MDKLLFRSDKTPSSVDPQIQLTTYEIELRATAGRRFSVRYGQQLKSNLGWLAAAHMLGECLFHRLECESGVER
jgi:hypothetical protein